MIVPMSSGICVPERLMGQSVAVIEDTVVFHVHATRAAKQVPSAKSASMAAAKADITPAARSQHLRAGADWQRDALDLKADPRVAVPAGDHAGIERQAQRRAARHRR